MLCGCTAKKQKHCSDDQLEQNGVDPVSRTIVSNTERIKSWTRDNLSTQNDYNIHKLKSSVTPTFFAHHSADSQCPESVWQKEPTQFGSVKPRQNFIGSKKIPTIIISGSDVTTTHILTLANGVVGLTVPAKSSSRFRVKRPGRPQPNRFKSATMAYSQSQIVDGGSVGVSSSNASPGIKLRMLDTQVTNCTASVDGVLWAGYYSGIRVHSLVH